MKNINLYMKEGYNSVISLEGLLLKVNIGITEQERDIPQDIKISLKFFYKDFPSGCNTDNIADTVCYHKIADIVTSYCKSNKVKLLEYLCLGLHRKIRLIAPEDVVIWIRVEKCNPPIDGMLGGTSFEYGDF
ncbi:MAG: dihydroneopterin aldolase [Rickettsiales bacterium]|nr:dihydroneopterin aldolase [Pseudomonadota bacterium]MDA0965893.1 dihydroneopterin aldolase [Pseudomonadota bacterium]MDG4542637.1 dihydroneopterin aldolase [Rickettsiales bacterium]MDG4545141.1 dihydroneopterin aldolase [Rickettsiales bacterium]